MWFEPLVLLEQYNIYERQNYKRKPSIGGKKLEPVHTAALENFLVPMLRSKKQIFVVPKSGNLKDHHFNLIVIPNGCLNDDIIHLRIKKIDPTLQGLQDAVLSSPVNSFLIRVMKSANKPFAGMLSETPAVVKNSIVGLTQIEFVEFCSNAELPMCRIKWVDLAQ